jgi:uncharacterized membrane protein
MASWVVVGSIVTSTVVTLLLVALAAMLFRTYRSEPSGGVNTDGLDSGEFSLARYEPMGKLLADEDFLFLAAQPGYRPEIGAKLRRERRQIFRLYLRELSHDFHRLHAEARRMVADSTADQSELVALLLRQQLAFWRGMAAIEVRLAFGPSSAVDARPLIESIEAMSIALARVSVPVAV